MRRRSSWSIVGQRGGDAAWRRRSWGRSTARPTAVCTWTRGSSVSLDQGFFRQLAIGFKAPGDFGQAYVIAHEMGHHVQKFTGVFAQVQEAAAERAAPPNELSIRQELHADCPRGRLGPLDVRAPHARERRRRRGAARGRPLIEASSHQRPSIPARLPRVVGDRAPRDLVGLHAAAARATPAIGQRQVGFESPALLCRLLK
jgi:putative neutral zinc metallopeptidase